MPGYLSVCAHLSTKALFSESLYRKNTPWHMTEWAISVIVGVFPVGWHYLSCTRLLHVKTVISGVVYIWETLTEDFCIRCLQGSLVTGSQPTVSSSQETKACD